MTVFSSKCDFLGVIVYQRQHNVYSRRSNILREDNQFSRQWTLQKLVKQMDNFNVCFEDIESKVRQIMTNSTTNLVGESIGVNNESKKTSTQRKRAYRSTI